MGKRFNKIQSAIEAAERGDVIKVAPGLYTESLTIKKPIEIIGPKVGWGDCTISGEAPLLRVEAVKQGVIQGLAFVIKGGGSSPAARISNVSEKFQIRDCEFDGRGSGQVAIRFDGKSRPLISNVKTHDFTNSGWEVTDACAPVARDCYFSHNSGVSVWFSGAAKGELFGCVLDKSSGEGIVALGKSSPKITNTRIHNHAAAFRIIDHADVSFENCVVSNCDRPGTIEAQAALSIGNSTFTDNPNGVILVRGESSLVVNTATFGGNSIFGIKGIGRAEVNLTNVTFDSQKNAGVSVGEYSVLAIEDCNFRNCNQGIAFDTSSTVKQSIASCSFFKCGCGIRMHHNGIVTCTGSSFDECSNGIEASNDFKVFLKDSDFSHCTGFALKTSRNCYSELNNCTFRGGNTSVVMEDSSQLVADSCSWRNISGYGVDAKHTTAFTAQESTFTACTQGLHFAGNVTG
ncbi:MAG: right-handed parallel beta-helix repeat-containing protein, partial [Candidatus Hermodarchaeia archaeon]